jgi:HNH endonuclease.
MSDLRRSTSAKQYRTLYNTNAWRKLRQAVFARDNYTCRMAGCHCFVVDGRSRPNSAVANHIKPHKGDLKLFWDINNIETVCKECHDTRIQSREKRGFDTEIGANGWPTDPAHPVNR